MVGLARTPLAVIVGLALTTVACVRSQATQCGDLLCPEGKVCANDSLCVDQSLANACANHAAGNPCNLPEFGDGTCQAAGAAVLCIVGSCGDGHVSGIEACDGNDLGGKTCIDYGSTDAAGLKCNDNCTLDPSGCTAYCGDGVKDSSEDCDKGDFGGKTCIDFGFYGGMLVCTDDCHVNLGSCMGMCGDGVKNDVSEQCDGTDFGGVTCQSLGYLGAVVPLTCGMSCAYTPDSCTCGGDLCAKMTQQCVKDANGLYSCQ